MDCFVRIHIPGFRFRAQAPALAPNLVLSGKLAEIINIALEEEDLRHLFRHGFEGGCDALTRATPRRREVEHDQPVARHLLCARPIVHVDQSVHTAPQPEQWSEVVPSSMA